MAMLISYNEKKGRFKLFITDAGWAKESWKITSKKENAKRFFSLEEITDFVTDKKFLFSDIIYEIQHIDCEFIAYDNKTCEGFGLNFNCNNGKPTHKIVGKFGSDMMPFILDGHEIL